MSQLHKCPKKCFYEKKYPSACNIWGVKSVYMDRETNEVIILKRKILSLILAILLSFGVYLGLGIESGGSQTATVTFIGES